ncbi:MAG: bifunctional 3-(3-hydroxy-phenyl)propionate/3-hydroxycinnamic acid hydroxylase [Rhodobacteraceae bacterium]|nr:bifunctional 3-(3-hydroxy-phenyl)propionate/3-hydroxycinnamic acid hydroxylase [Paracoccaceae bacterium]
MKETDFDIIQIGYGPVSKVSALLFDRLGWRVGVFERFGELYPLPRAVCIDHEINRMMHAAGLGEIARAATSPAPVYRWFNKEWKELLTLDWTGESVSGGPGTLFVHQPSLESLLHDEVRRRANIELNFETECVDFADRGDHVEVTVRDTQTKATRTVTARYLIGIDGANSTVRQKLGITRTDLGFEADWLVVDFLLKEGLGPRDLGLVECGQWCNPERPTTIVPGGVDLNGRVLRRWEFMRLPSETKEEMVQEAKVKELLGDWIKPEQGDLIRHALYTFRSLVADEWRRGRVILAGDAAHLMPPFMGQGMCAGLRDIWNLSWKLDRVLRGTADESLLDTYMPERRPHVTEVIEQSMFLGSIICIPDPAAAAERDQTFLSGEAPPPAPFPILNDGLLARGPDGAVQAPAGDLSPHGTVRLRRRTGRYDAFVPAGFTLILDRTIPESDLPAATCAALAAMGVKVVTIAHRVGASDTEIADSQGQFLPYMQTQGVHALLVRPDFFVFGGAADVGGLARLVEDLSRQMADFGMVEGGAAVPAA